MRSEPGRAHFLYGATALLYHIVDRDNSTQNRPLCYTTFMFGHIYFCKAIEGDLI